MEGGPASGPSVWVLAAGRATSLTALPRGGSFGSESRGALILSLSLPALSIHPPTADDLDGLLSELPEDFFCGTSSWDSPKAGHPP